MLQKLCNQLANRSFLSSRLDFLTDIKNLATMFRKLLLVSFFVLPTFLVHAQYNIIATETESWITPNFPSSDYNLNSSYLFLLNPSALQAVFEGDGLNKGEKKDVGLKKGDYPQYMYLAATVKDPNNEANVLTIPLMIHDVRDPSVSNRVVEYGGRFLEAIPDDILKNRDIVAKIRFEAFKGNNSNEFWKKTAEISIGLGKTAANLLKNPIAGTFTALTEQIIPQVDKGLKSMEHMEDPHKIVSEFYIKLLSKELSALYEEKVVSATLYRIHWDIEKPAKSRFFTNAKVQKVDDVKRCVGTTTIPFILVVNTKAEYNTDHSQLAYNQQYIEKKTRDFRKIQNSTKKEVERGFLEALKLAVELQRQTDLFQNSLNTKYPDWLAFSRCIELYFNLDNIRKSELAGLNKLELSIREKYQRLYSNLMTDVDLWYHSELLQKGRSIATYLSDNPNTYQAAGKTPRQLYEDIERLDFYRERLKQIEIQGKLPKEVEALESYTLALRRLSEMETALFELDFSPDARMDIEAKKSWLMNRASQTYPLCQTCGQRVGERITALENATVEENIRKYKEYSTTYYGKLSCYEELLSGLDNYLKSTTESATPISPVMIESVKRDREDLSRMVLNYSEIVGRDYTAMKPKELSDLVSRYQLNRDKMATIIQRLKGTVIPAEKIDCL